MLLLTDGDELVSYCTYAKKDDIQPTDLTPWMGNESLAQKVSFLTGVGYPSYTGCTYEWKGGRVMPGYGYIIFTSSGLIAYDRRRQGITAPIFRS